MHLHSIFRVTTPFAILTSYDQWRICWLDNDDSNALAATSKLDQLARYRTPTKGEDTAKEKVGNERDQGIDDHAGNVELGNKPPSPTPPPTPSRAKGTLGLQDVDQDGIDDEEAVDTTGRTFCGTIVMPWNHQALPVLLASVIQKMMRARQLPEPTVLRLANATTSTWKEAPSFGDLRFNLCISPSVSNFFLWEDLGHGADGKAFLVSGGTKGAVGVLKFFYSDEKDKEAEHEKDMWMRGLLTSRTCGSNRSRR